MLNSEATYYDAGMKAGRAMKVGDVRLYNFIRDWYRKASRLETDADKTLAGIQWDQGYHDGRA